MAEQDANLDAENQTLRQQVNELGHALDDAQGEIDDLKQQNNELAAALSATQQGRTDAMSDADRQRLQRQELGRDVDRRDAEIRQVRIELDEIKRRLGLLNIDPPAVTSSEGACSTTSPTTVGAASEGSESAESTSFAIAAGAVDLWVCSRIGYFHSGDQKLYAYFRKLSLNSCGKLYAISAETRAEIDTPEV